MPFFGLDQDFSTPIDIKRQDNKSFIKKELVPVLLLRIWNLKVNYHSK